MSYNFDQYYTKQPEFPLQKAEMVTARTLSQWTTYYEAELLAPYKSVKDRKRSGLLPANTEERLTFVHEALSWIQASSSISNLFSLTLYQTFPPAKHSCPLFSHPGTASDWYLNLDSQQFKILQTALENQQLPLDLFYADDQTVIVPYKLFGRIHFGDYYYSPNQWQAKQNTNPE